MINPEYLTNAVKHLECKTPGVFVYVAVDMDMDSAPCRQRKHYLHVNPLGVKWVPSWDIYQFYII